MIDTYESTLLVLGRAFEPRVITIPLEKAQGEILLEDLAADRDFPPYNRVAMDGIAVSSNIWRSGKHSFKITGVQASGSEPLETGDPGECIEIMTGASLPSRYDAVIRYEDFIVIAGSAVISNPDLKPEKFLNIVD